MKLPLEQTGQNPLRRQKEMKSRELERDRRDRNCLWDKEVKKQRGKTERDKAEMDRKR